MRDKLPSRNDPCPCGSGKLYKHCCKPSHRERIAKQRKRVARARPDAPRRRGGSPSLASVRSLIEQYRDIVPEDQVQELERLLDIADEVTAYEEMRDEIDAASTTLEAHRAEFEALDLDAMMELAERLFAEERFRPFRFKAQDVYRAFEAVGYPQHATPDLTEHDADIIHDATLHLASKELRANLARKLMMWMSEYVAAGRYLDAWMLQYCAFQMLNAQDRSNPFLGLMFTYGLDEWLEQLVEKREALMHDVGLDPYQLSGMTVGELEAWLEERLADPETRARFQTQIDEDTLFRDQASAEMWEMQVDSIQLLEREDAEHLLLSPQEVEPWLPALFERLQAIEEQALAAAAHQDWTNAEVQKTMSNALFETAEEMTPALFTPSRVAQLAAELRSYRDELSKAGDKVAAMHAQLAAGMLATPDEPLAERFLIGVCMASLRMALIALAETENARMAKD